ncbi:hypothetical protein CHELA20_11156 [Hyphomicrobiales bacterium]|nr:hypothetical protein CHELA20_11156 [Hyphomicrobiales bacterium]CAH1695056.1 hypothetical protein CHELA41_51385 [Hyphomicrobiales bacterium]
MFLPQSAESSKDIGLIRQTASSAVEANRGLPVSYKPSLWSRAQLRLSFTWAYGIVRFADLVACSGWLTFPPLESTRSKREAHVRHSEETDRLRCGAGGSKALVQQGSCWWQPRRR